MAVVFPVIMFMQMMSAGGMGGGVASAVARALGAGRKADADALVLHSVIIAVALGLIFTLGVLIWGSALYRLLGGQGPALQVALSYSNIVFAGSVAIWLFNTLGRVLRGGQHGFAGQSVPLRRGIARAFVGAVDFRLGPNPKLRNHGRGICAIVSWRSHQ